MFPTPHSVTVEKRTLGAANDLGERAVTWTAHADQPACAVWVPSSDEPYLVGHDRTVADLCIIAPVGFPVTANDRVIWHGETYYAVGDPHDWTEGPWWNPGVKLWNFKKVTP